MSGPTFFYSYSKGEYTLTTLTKYRENDALLTPSSLSPKMRAQQCTQEGYNYPISYHCRYPPIHTHDKPLAPENVGTSPLRGTTVVTTTYDGVYNHTSPDFVMYFVGSLLSSDYGIPPNKWVNILRLSPPSPPLHDCLNRMSVSAALTT